MKKSSRLAAVFLMVFGLMLAGGGDRDWVPKHMTPEEQDQAAGPAVSSPQIDVAPNGDLDSPYPPYFRPDRTGSGHHL